VNNARQRGDESWAVVKGFSPPQVQANGSSELLSFHVNIVEYLKMVCDKADRRYEDTSIPA
jgi:hypothetical protein